jgi:alanine racemase
LDSLMTIRSCWVEICTRTLEENFRFLLTLAAPHAELMAVLKADAYGHSITLCGPAVVRAGARWLGVACVEEGVAARALCPEARVLVFCGAFPGQGAAVVRHDLTAVVWQPWQLDELETAAREAGMGAGSVPVHLEIDTGMSRQGVPVSIGLDDGQQLRVGSRQVRQESIVFFKETGLNLNPAGACLHLNVQTSV